ncbi:hypothetical protein GGR57DRAFT_506833 [Xylariaceae sp. FL1272]|nr:hypothetical protein GGR57DRAFT_506833 [Xylariaceae sp. FL1272]
MSVAARYVPTEEKVVVCLDSKTAYQEDKPSTEAWMVHTTTPSFIGERLWSLPVLSVRLQENYPEFQQYLRQGSFKKGRPVLDVGRKIHSCGGVRRPKILYRVIHRGQPWQGLKARGYGFARVTPIYFHRFVQKHLVPSCRLPSPFLSVTDSKDKVRTTIEYYRSKGYKGIRVVKFRTDGPGWNHRAQPLWHVPALGVELSCNEWATRPMHRHEYLLQSHIPHLSIIHIKAVSDDGPSTKQWKRNTIQQTAVSRARARATGFTLRI